MRIKTIIAITALAIVTMTTPAQAIRIRVGDGSGTNTTNTSTTNNGTTYYASGQGVDVNVCGDSTASNDSANWAEHNANPVCQGCIQGQGCGGARVEVYKCTLAESARENGGLKCERNRSNGSSSYESFSTWFNDPYKIVQIDVFDGYGNLKDFVVWRGNLVGSNPTPAPTPVPTPVPTQPMYYFCPEYRTQYMQTFHDVPVSHPYHRYIQSLECDNVVHGYTDGTVFRPDTPLTRGAMAKILSNGFRYPENLDCTPFPDVPRDSKFYIEILTMKCWGITTGYGDGTFRQDDLIRRDEAMTLIIKAARVIKNKSGFMRNTTNYQVYTDVPPSSNHYDAVMSAYSNGIIDPYYSGNMYYPSNYIKRQEMALYVDVARKKL